MQLNRIISLTHNSTDIFFFLVEGLSCFMMAKPVGPFYERYSEIFWRPAGRQAEKQPWKSEFLVLRVWWTPTCWPLSFPRSVHPKAHCKILLSGGRVGRNGSEMRRGNCWEMTRAELSLLVSQSCSDVVRCWGFGVLCLLPLSLLFVIHWNVFQ